MSEQRVLGVVGAGNMGSGIAQKIAMEGFKVILVDLGEDQVARGARIIEETLAEAVARKIVTPEAKDEIVGRIEGTTDWSRLSEVELVIEAVFENLEVKQDVFKRLGEHARPETVLATNTSSFYVRDVAAVTPHPERVVGLHYFYHPAKNRLVEVVPHEGTAADVTARSWAIQEAIGKTPIASADAPGFVVNRYFVPWLNEAVRLLDEGMGDIPTIEAAAKKAFKIGMGPFELMNVTGVPIALHAATTLGEELGPMYAPCDRLAQQVESGELWSLDGDADTTRFGPIEERLLGVSFLIAGEIVDQDVGTIEDTDIGARVGLRWAMGPFELMNRIGGRKAVDMASAVATRYEVSLPDVLARQAESGEPFPIRVVQPQIDETLATLAFNRPDAMNAINATVVDQLDEAFSSAAASDAKGIVLAGKGKGFVAGADIRYFVKNIEAGNLAAIRAFTERGQKLLNRFAETDKMVIARLHGLSLGGGSEMALACDAIVATEKGSLGFPETGIGIYPGLGGTQRLTRRVGVPLARWLVLTGMTIDARTAHAIGAVDEVCAFEDLQQTLKAVAGQEKPATRTVPTDCPAGFESLCTLFDESNSLDELLAMDPASGADGPCSKALKMLKYKAPIALRLADKFIIEGARVDLAAGLRMELDHLDVIFNTADAYEGLSSLGRARPVFKGE